MRLEDLRNLPDSLEELSFSELEGICGEIRALLIDIFAKVGGHVAPNLGIIEIAAALHYVFDSPHDEIVWDVSHTSLPHKIFTGRLDIVKKFHLDGGISPFTNIDESVHDHFNIGHT
jgi:1-deoxy-D-xylulose-5-phosphate synthase